MTLPTAYLPPLEYFSLLPEAEVEIYENFPKRTLRNRSLLFPLCQAPYATPTASYTLTIPVCKANSKQLTRDVRIAYQLNWQQQHWHTIESLYRHTPYFIYFEDYLRPFYERHYEFLIDFNSELNATLLSLLNHQRPTSDNIRKTQYTTSWQGPLNLPWENQPSLLAQLFDC